MTTEFGTREGETRLPNELENIARIRHRYNSANEVAPRRRINWPPGVTGTDSSTNEEVTLAFSLPTGALADNSVTFAKLQDLGTDTLVGRDTAGTGDPESITVGGGIEFTGSSSIRTTAFTGDVTKTAGGTALTIANDAVTYAKLQNISATSRLLGRITAGAGDTEELTTAGLIEFSGTGIRNAAIGGDITMAAGSTSSAITSGVIVSADFNSEGASNWTPTVGGTGWALGNGTVAGKYIRHGRMLIFSGSVSWGSTSTFGAGGLQIGGFTDPEQTCSFVCELWDLTGALQGYTGFLRLLPGFGGNANVDASVVVGANVPRGAVTSTVPFTWANGDLLEFNGAYTTNS